MDSVFLGLWPLLQRVNGDARRLRRQGHANAAAPRPRSAWLANLPAPFGRFMANAGDRPIHSAADQVRPHDHYVSLNTVSTIASTAAASGSALQILKIGKMKHATVTERKIIVQAAVAGALAIPSVIQSVRLLPRDDERYSWFNQDATALNAIASVLSAHVAIQSTQDTCNGADSCFFATAVNVGLVLNVVGSVAAVALAYPLFGSRNYHRLSFLATAAASLGTYLASLPSAYSVRESCVHGGVLDCIGDVAGTAGAIFGVVAALPAAFGFGELTVP